MIVRKFKKPILCFENEVFSFLFFLCVFSVFVIFHSRFWLSLGQQGGRVHISKRRHISMNLYLYHHGETKIRCHIIFSEKLFNLKLSGRSFHKTTFASFRYFYFHKNWTSLWWCWLIWLSATIDSQKLTDLTCAFSQ